MRTLNEYWNLFVEACDFGSIEVNEYPDTNNTVARVTIDETEFYLAITYSESFGIMLSIHEGINDDFAYYWEDELDENEAFILQFIYNWIAS